MTLQVAAVGAIALVSCVLLLPVARWVGVRAGLVDVPRAGEVQTSIRARTGGYAMVAAFLMSLAASTFLLVRTDVDEVWRLGGLVAGLAIVVPVAVMDDRVRLGPGPQFLGQILAALVPIPFGLYLADVSSPWGELVVLPLAVAVPLTVIWVVGMVNTVNWLDTMDGLAGGISAIAALVLLLRTTSQDQWTVAVLPIALLGVCLGFLPFNFAPARIFMGTSGSMFLGYALAMISIIGGAKLATALMVLGLPILDTALVIVQRIVAGRSPFRGGDSVHLTHRLRARGWGIRRIVLSLYAGCLAFGVGGLYFSGPYKAVILTLFAGIVVAVAFGLTLRRRPTQG